MAKPAQIQMEKISAQMRAGQFAGAAKTAGIAFKKFPKEIGFANAAGSAHAQAGNFPMAVTFFNKALVLAPGDPGTQDNLIRALIHAGRAEKALELINRLLEKRAEILPLLVLKANAEMALDRVADAIETTTGALGIAPNNAELWGLRGIAHDGLRQDEAAISDFQRAFDLAPQDPTPLVNMAEPLTRRHRTDEALATLKKALALRPDDLRARRFLAIQLAHDGNEAGANAEYLRLLKDDPLDVRSYRALVSSQSAEENASLAPQIDNALSKLPRKSEDHGALLITKGNLLFQKGDTDAASQALAEGNAIVAKNRPYNKAAAKTEFDTLIERFSTPPASPNTKENALRPIFVIGQPRSGTTLCEMILSGHPDVESCGEMETAARILDPAIAQGSFDPEVLEAGFLQDLPQHADTTRPFVDKMPSNYRLVGPLAETFPNARFVHVARDPRDVALSMWRVFFPSSALHYVFDLRAMAQQANLYRRYMNHWEALYADRILTLNYRDIVSDVEGASRTMADFCGLEWTAEMASPEENTAMVRTASLTQVRKGVHDKSVGGWRAMEGALQPFLDALDPELWADLE